MKNINIGRTITTKRGEKGITQDELANFIGVSRSSVSKWESGQSYPDIVFLPQLASYFDISLDELMGYEPQMAVEDIRRLNVELLKDFAAKPIDDVMGRCRDIIKKYYSCYPLLYQIGMLFMNYSSTDDEKKASIIAEAKELFIRVKTQCDNIELKQLAFQSEALCEMMLGNFSKVIALLENERRYSFQPSVEAMLSQSYQMLGKVKEAKITLQENILRGVIEFFYNMTSYLAICTDDINHFEETCRRTVEVGETFRVKEIFPIAILPFYL